MMKKDKLYSINQWNRPLLSSNNLFYNGGEVWGSLAAADKAANPWNYADDLSYIDQYKAQKGGWFNISKGANPFSKGNIGNTSAAAANAITPVVTSAIGGGYSTGGVGEGIAGVGSAVGNAVGGPWGAVITAGSGIIGGLTNRAFGTKENTANTTAIKQSVADKRLAGNTLANAATSNDLLNLAGQMTSSSGFNTSDLYKGGWFAKGKARKKGQKLIDQENAALAYQNQGLVTGAESVDSNLDNAVMSSFYAFGGPIGISPLNTGAVGIMQTDKYINAINNRTNAIAKNTTPSQASASFSPLGNAFAEGGSIHIKPSHRGIFTEKANRAGMGVQQYASHVLANKEDYPSSTVKQANFARNAKGWKHDIGGGLEGAFLDNFSKNPIAAVMEYNRGLEAQRAAQEEAIYAEAQQAEYENMQKQVAALEAQKREMQSALYPDLSVPTLMEKQRKTAFTNDWQSKMPKVAATPSDSMVMARMRQSLEERGVKKRTHQDAIIANMMVESGGDPNAKNKNSTARGLMQWLKGRHPKAWDWDSQVDHIVNTYNKFGGDNWLNKDAYRRFQNTTDSAEAARLFRRYWERPEASTYKMTDKYINQMYGKKKAFGGELGTNGTDFTNGLLEINAGDSHENNPFEGVQLGFDQNGIPNLVEEGETVYNDYVYSKRMTVPAFMKQQLGLGNNEKDEITFADASKKIAEASSLRPNNPMDKAYLADALGKLAQVQEAERARVQAEEANAEMEAMNAMPLENVNGFGGNLFADGGAINWLKNNRPNIPPRTRERVAKLMEKKIAERYPKGAPSSLNYGAFYDGMYGIIPKINTESNLRKHYSDLVNEGFSPEVAASLVTSQVYKGNPLYNNLDAFKKDLVQNTKPSNSNVDQNRKQKVADFDAAVERALAARNAKETTVKTQKVNNTTNAVPRGTTTPRATNVMQPTNDSGVITPKDVIENGTWNIGDLGWLNNPQYQAGNEGIPFSRTASPEEIATIEASKPYTDWTDYVVENWGNPEVQRYLQALDTITGGKGNLLGDNIEAAQQYFRNARNDGMWGYYHLTPEQLAAQAAANQTTANAAPANTGNEIIHHAVEGDEDYLDQFGVDPSTLGAETRRVTRVNDNGVPETVIYHANADKYNGVDAYTNNEAETLYQPAGQEGSTGEKAPYQTWMRYAPAVGAGIMTLTDLLGLTNKPDYTYANRLEAAANRAGYAPNISYRPIGDYIKYRPMDIWAEQNRLNANARATDRALMNSGTVQGSKMAGLLANEYNNQIGSGQLYRNALEYNDNLAQQVADFNRKTSMFNSQMGLEADTANARYRQAGVHAQLQGLAQAAALRDSIDQRVGAARSANITNLLESLGNIGRENFALNQIYGSRAANNGYWSDRKGITHHNACGGKMKKK